MNSQKRVNDPKDSCVRDSSEEALVIFANSSQVSYE